MVLFPERIHNLECPHEELNKCPQNFSFVSKKTLRPTGYLCAKIELKIIIFMNDQQLQL